MQPRTSSTLNALESRMQFSFSLLISTCLLQPLQCTALVLFLPFALSGCINGRIMRTNYNKCGPSMLMCKQKETKAWKATRPKDESHKRTNWRFLLDSAFPSIQVLHVYHSSSPVAQAVKRFPWKREIRGLSPGSYDIAKSPNTAQPALVAYHSYRIDRHNNLIKSIACLLIMFNTSCLVH